MGALFFYDSTSDAADGIANAVGNLVNSVVGADTVGSDIGMMSQISNEIDTLVIDVGNEDFV